MSPNLTGALLMMASMACFTVNDSLLKATDGAVPLFQLIFLRGALTTLLIFGSAGRLGSMSLRGIGRADWKLIGLRCIGEIAAAYFFLSALFHMPLGNVTAILQALPLSITLVSALMFREAVGWRRMAAIGVGFVGVLLIVRPGTDGFNIWSIYALLAVLCVTLRDLSTRRLSPGVPSMTVTLVTAVAIMIASGLAALSAPWAPITPPLGMMILGSSVFVLGGYFFSVRVMRIGDVSFVAPFRYTGLIWALLLGWFVFGDWPSGLTLLGAGIIVGTGLFTLYRERMLLSA